MLEMEGKLQKLIQKYTDLEFAYPVLMMDDEAWIDQHFGQHTLADQCWEQMMEHYEANSCWADKLRLLQRRCYFHKAAYPGLSGSYAWAQEALGDFYRDHADSGDFYRDHATKVPKKGKGSSSGAVKAATPSPQRLELA